MEAYAAALTANVVTEDEVRAQLDGHPVFGALPEMELPIDEPEPEPVPFPPGPPEPAPE